MALPTDWQDRIQKEAGINTLALGPEANVRVNDPRYVSDAYQYYLNQGRSAAPGGITAATTAPIVQDPMAGDAQVASQIAAQDRGAGITAASAIQPPMDQAGAVAAMTQPAAYNVPGTMPQTPVSGAWGPQDYLQRPQTISQDPMTGDAALAESIYSQKPPMLGDSGFKSAYAKARGGGADKFTFKGKSYLTKKPSELKKKSLREKLTGYKTQSGYEEARTKRIKEKRIASMEKRKGEGKSYSAKNLAGLKGSEKKSKYITKKTMPSVRKPS